MNIAVINRGLQTSFLQRYKIQRCSSNYSGSKWSFEMFEPDVGKVVKAAAVITYG